MITILMIRIKLSRIEPKWKISIYWHLVEIPSQIRERTISGRSFPVLNPNPSNLLGSNGELWHDSADHLQSLKNDHIQKQSKLLAV